MITATLFALVLAQAPCADAMTQATARAEEFDLAGAAERLRSATASGCSEALVGAWYLTGMLDARTAFRQGAPPAMLDSVRMAITVLEKIAGNQAGAAQIARLLLQAAAAGAQSERAEMALYLDTAIRMEELQRAANQRGAPIVSSLELAGDLWLQLFGYAEAQAFYRRALAQQETMRARAGLARATARLGSEAAACAEYTALVKRWGTRQTRTAEILEAEEYLRRPGCRNGASR